MKLLPFLLSGLLYFTTFHSTVNAQNTNQNENNDQLKTFVEVVKKTAPMNELAYRELQTAVEAEGMSMTRYEMLVNAARHDTIIDVRPSVEEREKLEKLEKTSTAIKSRIDKQLDVLLENSSLSKTQFDSINKAYKEDMQTRMAIDELMTK